ncbi:extensin family protein [Falsochrobactrum tianjinense]
MSVALSNRFRHPSLPASLILLAVASGCSGERPPRPQAEIGNVDDIIAPGAPVATAAPQEDRIIGLAEEEESHAISPVQDQPEYSSDYGFTSPIQNPVSAAENVYTMSNADAACRTRLKRLGVVFTEKPSIYRSNSCHIDNPIEVSAFASGSIAFKPAATLNCQVTEAFARWIKGDLQPSARLRYLSGVNTIYNAGGYSCRTMNHRRGAKMSEHSRGNAIDVTKITLNNGKNISVRKPGFFAFREKGLLNSVRSDACDYFTTVLGPGYNREHADHFHFDLMPRRNGYRTCK